MSVPISFLDVTTGLCSVEVCVSVPISFLDVTIGLCSVEVCVSVPISFLDVTTGDGAMLVDFLLESVCDCIACLLICDVEVFGSRVGVSVRTVDISKVVGVTVSVRIVGVTISVRVSVRIVSVGVTHSLTVMDEQ